MVLTDNQRNASRTVNTHPIILFMAGIFIVALSGCSSSKEELLPPGDSTMMEIWQGNAPSPHTVVKGRETLRRGLSSQETLASERIDESYSRTQENELSQIFPRLPNPDMVMYIFPHLAEGNTPVPGYSTVFPFYEQTQYALPGERTEAL
ncbi:TIGR03751 family conjugal transfer lipoprotein [Salmonella enterica]|uniref:TIGR03751 family conjugal transfer lipoprotein n=1 Tax=Salmonella enterica TaxID=28901 RepID=UPI0007D6EF6F|nr:TIGR03751 family conjugal transfer lipoprotein [Salmonella enterica]EKH4058928.1 TIGR03751 family conjugal transfer lipoprotein [Salmonella enterica subsp. enterica serovar Newport]EFR0662731.1 TIGR03751 family conjugal transfer lipoprotein [Salmonella enterica]EFR0824161.1 TIGR03751 family conjugal transfer lipoprotein [Salmonella enterica subsp. enterica serovar Indiana]EIL0013582.1 TIGR03751 family conjugal transfer lipoprotein [Salmonella enterica]EKB2824938.1 TIGR03751 family conjugal 